MPQSKRRKAILGNENRCQFRLVSEEFTELPYQCPHTALADSSQLCLFHLPKAGLGVEHPIVVDFGAAVEKWILIHVGSTAEFVDFKGVEFPDICFKPVAFPKKACFDHSVFNGDANFNVNLPKAKPEHRYDTDEPSLLRFGASFKSVHFKGIANFAGCIIDHGLDFSLSNFEDDAFFEGIQLDQGNFSNCTFKKKSSFSGANIGHGLFYKVKFCGDTDFSYFTSIEDVSFDNSEFFQRVELYKCVFGESNAFSEHDDKLDVAIEDNQSTLGSSETSFNGAVFHEVLDVCETSFNGRAEFDNVTFRKRAWFRQEKIPIFLQAASFSNVTLPKEEELIFERVDLAKAQFHDTPLDKVVFRDVIWGQPNSWIRRFLKGDCLVLWDEIRPLEGMLDYSDEAKTADNYRQLVINYESKRDYETAEAFHISEMEMRRKRVGERKAYSDWHEPTNLIRFLRMKLKFHVVLNAKNAVRRYLNGYGLYWASSRYGTSYRQATIVLILLIVLFATLFLFAGLTPTSVNEMAGTTTIEYNLFPDAIHHPVCVSRLLSDFRESLFFTLEIATFQKDRLYQCSSWHGRALVYPAVVLLTGQVALLLLSIRRRFRRQ